MIRKICLIIIAVIILPYAAFADYPVLPARLEEKAKEMLLINDARSTMLYEKISVTDDIDAWMIGWFWNDYKIVAGITENEEIIYYNKSPLGSAPVYTEAVVSKEDALNAAKTFVRKMTDGMVVKLVEEGAYTYKFAHYRNDIRVACHDIEVAVDKGSGEVYYYQGIIDTQPVYLPSGKLISRSAALSSYFDKLDMELVYDVKYNNTLKSKFAVPIYIFPNNAKNAVDAKTGELCEIVMYDCNYYFNDNYYDYKYIDSNNIKTDEAVFTETEFSETQIAADIENNIKEKLPEFGEGYSFATKKGTYEYYDEQGEKEVKNVWHVDVAATELKDAMWRLSGIYERGELDELGSIHTSKEYIFARMYIDDITNEIYSLDTVFSGSNKPQAGEGYTGNKNIPKGVSDFINANVINSNELKIFSISGINAPLYEYVFARYINGARVIGEGARLIYNVQTGEVIKFDMNMSCNNFASLESVLSQEEIKSKVKRASPMKLYYTDAAENTKKIMYAFDLSGTEFNPFTGAKIDSDEKDHTIISCDIDSGKYLINGNELYSDKPLKLGETTYLPLRLIAENFGFEVIWSKDAIRIVDTANEVYLSAGYDFAILNDERITITPPETINSVTYVSVETIEKLFGALSWQNPNLSEITLSN